MGFSLCAQVSAYIRTSNSSRNFWCWLPYLDLPLSTSLSGSYQAVVTLVTSLNSVFRCLLTCPNKPRVGIQWLCPKALGQLLAGSTSLRKHGVGEGGAGGWNLVESALLNRLREEHTSWLSSCRICSWLLAFDIRCPVPMGAVSGWESTLTHLFPSRPKKTVPCQKEIP